ncbi:uncharacterized protein FA14DRAFT_72704 [Meira miltonrushii]|uniref:Uncharacterized protein n=1 Tax=Meira miltonrushii TaxID=1280837 RepID=A0A316VAC1_9BASI|nr:uncharacterized protein FA14DRAFT_72704 [Meira miltonrushii]PWN34456.1 hypothetical protein FA14DRAFT_72704 [Meira miltonrushii]
MMSLRSYSSGSYKQALAVSREQETRAEGGRAQGGEEGRSARPKARFHMRFFKSHWSSLNRGNGASRNRRNGASRNRRNNCHSGSSCHSVTINFSQDNDCGTQIQANIASLHFTRKASQVQTPACKLANQDLL